MMTTLIQNGLLLLPEGIHPGWVLLREGRILDMATGSPVPPVDGLGLDLEETEVVDAEGMYVAPGFIDLHTHGAGGADFMDGTVEAYLSAAEPCVCSVGHSWVGVEVKTALCGGVNHLWAFQSCEGVDNEYGAFIF